MNRAPKQKAELSGSRVLILTGTYAGQEGVCVGQSIDGKHWPISPDGSNEILQLLFEKEFGLVLDMSANPIRN
jgi:hypothetical protein